MLVNLWQRNRVSVGFLVALVLILMGSSAVWSSISKEISATSNGIQPFYQGQTGQRAVALMFNVDWGEEYLPSIIQILRENQGKATFMVTGRWAKLHPELLLQIAEEGHEIGNHGYFHKHPNQQGRSELEEEIRRTQIVVEEVTGKSTRVFAPPYGEFNPRVLETAQSLGYPVIMWSLDTVDWRRPKPSTIVERVTTRVQPDYLILMHPTEPTVQALPQILAYLKEEGYSLISVSEIIAEGGSKP